jgi:hypothetical protein
VQNDNLINFLEVSLQKLYDNSVIAFPSTSKRQHAIDTIVVEHLEWIPFLGVKTLFVKGTIKNEGRKNEAIMLFKGVKYAPGEGKKIVPLMTSIGKKVFIEQISVKNNDILVRCTCKDFYWRFMHFDKNEKALFGKDRKKYEALYSPGSSNPEKLPGICKHLIKLGKILKSSNLLV